MNLLANERSGSNVSNPIPIIDFQPFIMGNLQTQKAVAIKLERAMREVGCFYLTNTAVSLKQVAQVFTFCQYFFALPQEEKEQLLMPPDGSYHGYIVKRQEETIINEKLSITLGLLQNPVEEVRDRRSQWFEEHPELCEPLSRAYQSFQKTVEIVFRAMAIALDAPQDYFTKLHGQQNDSMLLHHYPVLHPTLASNVLRNKEHIDYGSLSLLFQDEIGGLEVCTQAGDWIAVPPIENTPITILGNIMSRWTNDKYPGTKHRVSMPTTQHAMKERYSFGLFPAPDDRAAIACLETCLAPNEKPKYLPISTHDYYERGFQAKL